MAAPPGDRHAAASTTPKTQTLVHPLRRIHPRCCLSSASSSTASSPGCPHHAGTSSSPLRRLAPSPVPCAARFRLCHPPKLRAHARADHRPLPPKFFKAFLLGQELSHKSMEPLIVAQRKEAAKASAAYRLKEVDTPLSRKILLKEQKQYSNCDVCKLKCCSKSMLNSHLNGKKHKITDQETHRAEQSREGNSHVTIQGYRMEDIVAVEESGKEGKPFITEESRNVYNSGVYALAKGKCVDAAKDLLKTMEEKGLAADAVTFNSLIRPLCKARRLDDAREVFGEMLRGHWTVFCMHYCMSEAL